MRKIRMSLTLSLLALTLMLSGQSVFSQTDSSNVPVTELGKVDTVVGTGAEAVAGKTITVHYTGWLYGNKPDLEDHKYMKFDSSVDSNKPFTFPLGAGRVIKGWDQGLVGMKVGGKRMLTIPSELGYGARGAGRGRIPPNIPLVFDVELLEVK